MSSRAPHAAHAHWHASRQGFRATGARWRHSMRHSLKWRLVLTFLLLALAVSAVFLFGMKRVVQTGWEGYARPMVADYVDKLADEIGSPPDVAKASDRGALPVTVRSRAAVHFDSHPNLHRSWSYDDGDPRHGPESWGLVRTTADGHRIVFGLTGLLHRASQARTFAWVTLVALPAHVGGLRHVRACCGLCTTSAKALPLRRRRLTETDRRDPTTSSATSPSASTAWPPACKACSMPNARCCWPSATNCAAR
jgi:hypothetical protein